MSTKKIIKLDYENILSFAGKDVISSWQGRVSEACSALRNGTGPGSEYLGWLGLPGEIGEEAFSDIEASADKIKSQSDVFIVVGIGGSYLGARAVIEAVKPNFFNEKSGTKTRVYFAGQNISSGYMKDLLELVRDRDVSINVISKSGTTTEPGIAFRLLREMVESRYGEGAKDRIFATTDKNRGALRKLADNREYKTYVIPDNVGGRFSVLTPVGLLPIAAAGVNIRELVKGASDMAEACRSDKIFESPACTYAAIRSQMLKSGKQIEVLSMWSPKLHYIAEWWKQLFGESEGKEGKGIYPAACDLTTDLHSIGQYLQEGQRVIFETFILPGDDIKEICVRKDPENLDELNYLEGRSFDFINKKAAEGTAKAHHDGGAPNMTVGMPELNEYYLGQLLYFFELSCAISGYVLGVNPFNQPGVEVYKKNMFSLLGKPGY